MSIRAVAFPDVELWATTYLRAALSVRPEPYTANVYVNNVVPAQRHDRMCIVRRDGGPRLDAVREAARLNVRVWAQTEQDATDLARIVSALLWAAPDGDPVLRVEQPTGPTPVADESQQPLRLLAFEVVVRGTQLPEV
jgi:hypothetical protein